MSYSFDVHGMALTVDEVYAAMEKGNKQHMANKLYKHGWVPVRAVEYLPHDVVEELDAAREDDELDIATAVNIQAGDRVFVYDPESCMHGDEYIVIRNKRGGEFRLINLWDGNYWSFDSLFGVGEVKFTRKRVAE